MPLPPEDSDHGTILHRLARSIEPSDPIPMYHQIASVVRRAILSGALPIGAELPSVRATALALGVNYHTIRHAWQALGEEGVLSVRRGRGARVARAPAARGGWAVAHDASVPGSLPVAWVATASLREGAALAEQVAAAWRVVATAWPSDGPSPPPGTILLVGGAATAPARWPGRKADTHPIGVVLDRAVLSQVRRAAEVVGADRVVVVGDSTGPAGDLLRQLPRIGLGATAWTEPGFPPEAVREGALTVVLPGGDALVPAEARTDPRLLVLEPVLAPGPLARIGAAAGWRPTRDDDGPPQ